MRAGKASRKHRRGRTSLPTGVLAWTGVAALVCVGAATFAAALPGEPVRTLRGLSVSHDQGRVLVRIDVDTPVRYEAAMLSDPIRYVLHLHGVGASGRQPSDFSVDYGPVRDVAVVRDSADAHHVRVVVALREPTPCNAGRAADGRGMVIVVGDGGLDALAAAPDRPSVGGPRLALPTAGLTGSLWHGFLRAVRAEPAALPVVETPSVEPAAHLTVSTTTAVAIELEPVTTSANSVILPALAEQTAALKLPAIGARTADVKASRPTMQLVAAMMPGHGSVVTPASYAPLMSATPRLPRRAILTDIPGGTMLASLPTIRLPEIVRPAAVPVPAVAPTRRAAITSVWQRPAPNGFELHIETSANVGFHTERLSNPQRYVLHLPGTELTRDCARELQVDDGVVGRVRLVPNEQETAVSLELTGPA
ncbi:MAG: AMIN domain-containing protein, partial [Armatimonadota bacterium]